MDREDVDLESVDREQALIDSLSRGRAFDHPTRDVRVLDTHISWVVLTGDFAYKIKKPIKLAFLDYSTLEKRRHFCELELELNRRWAPGLYLDVVPICGSFESPVVGGSGTPIEYALKMRQFPQDAQLDAVLAAGQLADTDMFRLAGTIATIHASIPVCDASSGDAFFARIRQAMLDNFDFLQDVGNAAVVGKLESWTRRSLDECRDAMSRRYEAGFVRECHGDLHLKNLVRLSSGIVPYDCVEFSVELRSIDVISDISFLFMDLLSRDEPRLAWSFINRYLECSGDYDGVLVLRLYTVYHALIRAKIAAIRAVERALDVERQQDQQESAHYCAVALGLIEAPEPRLIIMHGFSGSGKTWLSERLMTRLPALRLRSDIERKRMRGLREGEQSGSAVAQGLYTASERGAVYERLAALAEGALAAGHNVIVDASFLERDARARFRELAQQAGVGYLIVSVSAPVAELQRRLESRQGVGRDASEADVAVLRHQLDHADALDGDERDFVIEVEAHEHVDIDSLSRQCLSAVSNHLQ